MRLLDVRTDSPDPAPADPVADQQVERVVVVWGCRLVVAAVIFQTVCHLVGFLAFDSRYGSLDANADLAPFAFASASATLFCGACALLLAATWPRRAVPLALLAAGLAYLSVDDMFAIHERISTRLDLDLFGIDDMGRALWPVVYLPLIGACFLMLRFVGSTLRPAPRRLLRLGLALLVVAIALEMFTLLLVNIGIATGNLAYECEVAVEEGAELAGWMLIGVALAATVLRGGPAIRR
jgi:hypothetical protein